MNDKRKESSALFMPSGCLTGDALMLFVTGELTGAALAKAQKHIADCALCTDAAEGLRLWLKSNKPVESSAQGILSALNSEDAGLTDEQPFAETHSNKPAASPVNKFHARTDILNERIKQRLHTHAIIEANEKKRLSYKPFVWIAAAASVIILIGSFYVVWIQNQIDIAKLTKQRAAEMAMLESPANHDTLNILLQDKNPALALAVKNVKGISKSTQTHENIIVEDAMVLNQDELSVASQAGVSHEKLLNEEVTAIKEDSKAVAADKANPEPAGYDAKMAAKKTVETEYEGKMVFTEVEEMPYFPGGEAERNKFLSDNITYPQQATENGIQGTVYTSFIVDSNGKIEDAKILRGIGGGCDEEALRVVKLMPRWKPGKQSGKPVRVLFNMPVYFKLQ